MYLLPPNRCSLSRSLTPARSSRSHRSTGGWTTAVVSGESGRDVRQGRGSAARDVGARGVGASGSVPSLRTDTPGYHYQFIIRRNNKTVNGHASFMAPTPLVPLRLPSFVTPASWHLLHSYLYDSLHSCFYTSVPRTCFFLGTNYWIYSVAKPETMDRGAGRRISTIK
jgi:hypothetical protein